MRDSHIWSKHGRSGAHAVFGFPRMPPGMRGLQSSIRPPVDDRMIARLASNLLRKYGIRRVNIPFPSFSRPRRRSSEMQLNKASLYFSRPAIVVASQRVAATRISKPRAVFAASALRKPVNAATVEKVDWEASAKELDLKSPIEIMDHALKTFGDDVAIAFSGAEDTYQTFDKVEKHYGIHIEYTFPESQAVQDLVRAKGMYSFYEDGHQECCRIRKPLRKALKGMKAWITGQRKDQSPGTRMSVPVVQVDPAFEGLDGGAGSLIKYNPMSNLTSAETWNFLRVQGVPVNELHFKGFDSIGCEPCTKAVLPNQHEREGRWWWEDATAKECGLHSGNVSKGEGSDGKPAEISDLWTEGSVVSVSKEQAEAMVAGNREKDTLMVLYAPWCQFCQALEPTYDALAKELAGSHVTVAKYQADADRDFATEKLGLKTFPTIVLLPKGRETVIKFPSERRDLETLQMWVKTMAGSA
eukprot:gene23967-9539_t